MSVQRFPNGAEIALMGDVQRSTSTDSLKAFIATHPLDPEDVSAIASIRAAASAAKGVRWTVEARPHFDALMEGVPPPRDVAFESGTVGEIPGLWIRPASSRPGEAILHLHGGWFSAGSPGAYRHFVGHIAARTRTTAFVPEYRLAPEHPFPAALDDVLSAYRGMTADGMGRLLVTGDSAGGNLALVLAARVGAEVVSTNSLLGVVALSPVTDLTLSGLTYETRADVDPYFTKPQVAELVHAYLGGADANDPLASPLHGSFSGLPPIRIHVGDDEVLLDDSRRYVERAVAAGVDARLDVWIGMPHGFVANIGTVKASQQALDAIGAFLNERLQDAAS